MKKFYLLSAALLLSACASPTLQMTQAQVASLSDDQVCKYKNNYRDETKLDAEIAHRNLNCDRFFRQCLAQGNQPGTKAMKFCTDILRENERIKYDNDREYGFIGSSIGNRVGIYNHIPLRR